MMHAIAHEGCTATVRESALRVDYWRKISCRNLGLEPESVLRLAFQSVPDLVYYHHHCILYFVR